MASKYFWDGIEIWSLMHMHDAYKRPLVRNITDGTGNVLYNDFPGRFDVSNNPWQCYTTTEIRPNFKVGTNFIIDGYLVKYSGYSSTAAAVTIPAWANAIKTFVRVGRGERGENKVLQGRHRNHSTRRARNNVVKHENFSTETNYGGLGSPAKYYYISKVISIPLNGTIDLTIINTGNNTAKIEVKDAISNVVAKIEMTGAEGTAQTNAPSTRNYPDRRQGNDTRDTNTDHRVISVNYRASIPTEKNLATVRSDTNGIPSGGFYTAAVDDSDANSHIWIYWFYQPPT